MTATSPDQIPDQPPVLEHFHKFIGKAVILWPGSALNEPFPESALVKMAHHAPVFNNLLTPPPETHFLYGKVVGVYQTESQQGDGKRGDWVWLIEACGISFGEDVIDTFQRLIVEVFEHNGEGHTLVTLHDSQVEALDELLQIATSVTKLSKARSLGLLSPIILEMMRDRLTNTATIIDRRIVTRLVEETLKKIQ